MNTKNILHTLAFALLATATVACDDGEGDNYIDDNGVKVVTSPETIAWSGGDATVTVSKAVATAYASADWLSVSSNGSSVTVTATENDNRESRNARLIVKASQTDSVIVSVSQSGLVFNTEQTSDIQLPDDEAHTCFLPVTTTGKVTVSECPDWVTPTVTADGITLDIAANTTGAARGGNFVFGIGANQTTVSISQFVAERDIFGKYIIAHYEGDEATFALFVDFEKDKINFRNSGVSGFVRNIPGTFDADSLTFTFSSGPLIGKIGSSYIYAMVMSNEGTVSFDNSTSGTFYFRYSGVWGSFIAELGGPFDLTSGLTAETVIFGQFTQMELNETYFTYNAVGQFEVMLKVKDESEAKQRMKQLKEQKYILR